MNEPLTSKQVALAEFIDIMRDPVELQPWMRQYIIDALSHLDELKRAADEPPAPSSKTLVEALENYCHCNQAVDFKCLPCRSRDEIERLTECLRQANEGFEKYERLYYLEQQKNEGDSDEPRACNHGAIAPKGTMFYHGFVGDGENLWRCDACKGVFEGNLTEPSKRGSQALTLVSPRGSEPPPVNHRKGFAYTGELHIVGHGGAIYGRWIRAEDVDGQPPSPHPEAVITAAARVETELSLAANEDENDPSFVADLRTLIAAVRAPETKAACHELADEALSGIIATERRVSCRCPAGPGNPCPLTEQECAARMTDEKSGPQSAGAVYPAHRSQGDQPAGSPAVEAVAVEAAGRSDETDAREDIFEDYTGPNPGELPDETRACRKCGATLPAHWSFSFCNVCRDLVGVSESEEGSHASRR